jgi:hypothetical protein
VISRRFKAAVIAGIAVGVSAVAGFGPVVRYEAGRGAERYGGTVFIQKVVPTWHGVRLRRVDVVLADVPSAKIHLDEVEVRFGPGARTVELHGGVISAVGAREEVLHEVESWRARYASPAASEAGHGSAGAFRTSIAGLNFTWKNDALAPTEAVSASDVSFSREDDRLSVSVGDASVVLGRASVDVKKGRLELIRRPQRGYLVGDLSADSLDAQLVVPTGTGDGIRAETEIARSVSGGSIRALLVGAARGLDAALEPSAKVQLGGVHARVRHGDDAVTLGPGKLEIARSEGRLVIDLAPVLPPVDPGVPGPSVAPGALPEKAQRPHEETLTFRLSIPLSEAPAVSQEIIADIQGGPIWLSSLGVKEGDFGLFNVAHTSVVTGSHLVLAPDGQSVRFDGEGKIHGLSLRSAALSDEPVAGLELAFRAKGDAKLDGAWAHVEAGEVDLGAIRLIGQGDYERVNDTYRGRAALEIPLTACQSMLDSIPKGLVPKLQGMRMAGSFGLKAKTSFDTAHLAHLNQGFVVGWDTSNTCRVLEAPAEINVEHFQKPFRRTVYDGDGHPVTIESGPSTSDWVALPEISKFMEVAVLTTEDGGFHRHHGFDHEAIKNSIRENLRQHRFVRGASTISMQLAKNLYLDRGKNLSRKLQEAILTMYLEQELTKEQILELYLNLVEFGPMLYGIGPAAQHYFNAPPSELSLGQALYISSIMPNPKSHHFGVGGGVTPRWMNYLRKLMKIAYDRHRITDQELDDGLRENVVRGSPSPNRDLRPPSGIGDDTEGPEPPEGAGDWLGP